MQRPKRFDYYLDEVDWSGSRSYRIRIPYIGANRIYRQTFSVRKHGRRRGDSKLSEQIRRQPQPR